MSAFPDQARVSHLLDVGGMQPPEPMVRILEALDTLGPDESLRVLIDREPVPLYSILARNGYRHRTAALPNLRYEVMIWQDPAP